MATGAIESRSAIASPRNPHELVKLERDATPKSAHRLQREERPARRPCEASHLATTPSAESPSRAPARIVRDSSAVDRIDAPCRSRRFAFRLDLRAQRVA